MLERYFKVFMKGSFTFKFCFIVPLVMPLFYFLAIFEMPYGYYVFLQIISLIFVGTFAWAYSKNIDCFLNYPSFSSWAIVILFNPFFPFEFEKGWWIFFDIVAILLLLGSFVVMLGHFDVVLKNEGEVLPTYAKENNIFLYNDQKQQDDFTRSAISLLTTWEIQRQNYARMSDQFVEGLQNVTQKIHSKIIETIEKDSSCKIKGSPVAIIDFSYAVFFSLYAPMCQYANHDFLQIFYEMYEAKTRDKFFSYITDPNFFDEFFQSRVDMYNVVCENPSNLSQNIIRQAAMFISNDFLDIKEVFVPRITGIAEAIEVIDNLFSSMTYQLKAFRSDLDYLNGLFKQMNDLIHDSTGHHISDFL